MKPAALIAQRMQCLRLHDRTRNGSVLETVKWMGALQAQDYESGLWAIGTRMKNVTRADVEAAIARREIVRTWPMRGTWHFIPAADARWMQELLASRLLPAIRKRSADFGFDEATVSRCRNVVVKALEGGRSLPRVQLVQRIGQAGFQVKDNAGNHLVRCFGNEGLLCNGVMAGKEPTFVLRDEWVSKPVKLDREAALAEIALRYFRSHGPAKLQDFVWWTGLAVRDARAGIASVGPTLSQRIINAQEHWFECGHDAPGVSAVELLPAFDEHLLGYQDRRAVLDDERADSICPGGNGVFRSTLVVKGRVAGLWKKKEAAKKLTIEVTPYESLNQTVRRRTEKAAQRLGAFLRQIGERIFS
jgi:DNA glycosylase AlkZ-like